MEPPEKKLNEDIYTVSQKTVPVLFCE